MCRWPHALNECTSATVNTTAFCPAKRMLSAEHRARALVSGAEGLWPFGVSGADLGTGSRLAHQDDMSVASFVRLCFASAAPPISCTGSTQVLVGPLLARPVRGSAVEICRPHSKTQAHCMRRMTLHHHEGMHNDDDDDEWKTSRRSSV